MFFDWDETGIFINKGQTHSILSELYLAIQKQGYELLRSEEQFNSNLCERRQSTTKKCKKEKQLSE
jgi:hypothetical protein